MDIRVGNILKEKKEYFKEKLRTTSGLFDMFIGNFIWGFLIIKYNQVAFGIINTFFSFIGWNWLRSYLSYTVFGLALIPLSIGITILTTQIFKYFKKLKKQIFGGR